MEEVSERKVAVVVVHGVASQIAGHNPRAVTKLLQGITFYEQEGAEINDFPREDQVITKVQRKRYSGWLEETFQIAAQPENRALRDPEGATEDLMFTRKLLHGYIPPAVDGIYNTIKFSGKRLSGDRRAGSGELPVDVFEVYWSDLSAVGTQLARIFTGLYSLLFHLAELGRLTLERSEVAPKGLGFLHTTTGWLLGRVLPLLFLPTFFLLMGQVPLAFEQTALRICVALLPALGILGTAIVRAQRKSDLGILILGAAALASGLLLFRWTANPPTTWYQRASTLLVVEWGVLSLAVIGLLVARLQAYAPSLTTIINQAFKDEARAVPAQTRDILAPLVVVALCAVTASVFLFPTQPRPVLTDPPTLWLMNLALFFYRGWLVGLALVGSLAVASTLWAILGHLTAWATPRRSQVCGTAVITLLVPFSLSLWLGNGFLALGNKVIYLCCELNLRSATLQALMVGREDSLTKLRILQRFTRQLDVVFAPLPSWCYYAVGGLVLAAMSAALVLLPSILQEGKSPQSPGTNIDARGRWLSRGYKILWGTLAVLTASAIADGVASAFMFGSKASLNATTSVVAVSSTGALLLLALMFQGQRVAQVLGATVGVGIDVDNHLRELPEKATPRARIFNRYVSLLRYLAHEGYSRIVIVAHSQGSVITADLLRYLAAADFEGSHSVLKRLPPISLFTMGSPLRQLYYLRFPDLYAWVVAQKDGPDPSQLFKVQTWVNAYRSGDYVGRRLLQENGVGAPEWTTTPFGEGNRVEFCIGEGAHTHYWDWSAPGIALELDRLIAE